MELKKYDNDGRLPYGYDKPDYFIGEIVKHQKDLLVSLSIDLEDDSISVEPYENGVVYNMNHKHSDIYDPHGSASLIVEQEMVTFVSSGSSSVFLESDEQRKEAIGRIGKKLEVDKIKDYEHSSNKLIRMLEVRQEKKQRQDYISVVSKSMEPLKELKHQFDEEKGKKVTPYQKIAKDALMNWNGLSEEEANNKIMTESVDELEGQVYAMGSVGYAVNGISQNLGLTEEEKNQFYNAVINGPADDQIFANVSAKASQIEDPNELELSVLATIHDGWVVDNSSEKTYQKKVDKGQLRQYAPLELIGWNEVKSDLLFLGPILESINVPINEEQLEKVYHEKVSSYAREMKITDAESLKSLVAEGKNYYPVLPEQLSEKLVEDSEVVTQQIIQNWSEKDPKSFEAINQTINMENNKGMKR